MGRVTAIAFLIMVMVITAVSVSQALIIGPPAPPPPTVSSVPIGNFPVAIAPTGIYVGSKGRIYVSDTLSGSVEVFSNNGVLLSTFKSVEKPIAIGGLNETLFVADGATGSVAILDAEGAILGKLGDGDSEFSLPNDIAVSQLKNMVFVTDGIQGVVKIYDVNGSFITEFGTGYLSFPTGIAVDDTAGEVYVVDDKVVSTSETIFVFDLNDGMYSLKRQLSLGTKVLRPQGIAVLPGTSSVPGRIFVADTFNSSIAVFDYAGTFVDRIGRYGSADGEFRIPLDIGFDVNSKLFVANYNNARVEVIGIDNYTALTATPSSLDFLIQEENAVSTHTVSVTSNQANVDWTASVSYGVAAGSWLSISAASGVTPSTLTVEANSVGLANGIYKGFVNLSTPSGVESVVEVNLVVDVQKALGVTPQKMDFLLQVDAEALPAGQQLDIYNSAGSSGFAWQASASAAPSQWLTVEPAAGTVPAGPVAASATVGLTAASRSLTPGTYAGQVAVEADSVNDSPQTVEVSLKVVYAGTVIVTSNLDTASFTLKGPVTYTGSGTYWRNDEVVPGKYKVDFTSIENYMKPSPQQITVVSGQTVTVDGVYKDKRVLKIGALSSAVDHASVLQVPEGSVDFVIPLFIGNGGGLVASDSAAGDIDGDGYDEIVFSSDTLSRVEVFAKDGILVKSIDFSPSPMVRVAMGDVDGDGRADLLIGTLSTGNRIVSVYGLDSSGTWTVKGLLATIPGEMDFRVSTGDIDGDGKCELIVSDSGVVAAYDIAGSPLWSVTNPFFGVPEVASGDIDGDGVAEVVVGAGADERNGTLIKVLRGSNGSNTGIVIDAFGDLGFTQGVSVAAGDVNDDGISEIFAGAGPSAMNPSLVRMFNGNGIFTGVSIDALGTASYGAKICVGKF